MDDRLQTNGDAMDTDGAVASRVSVPDAGLQNGQGEGAAQARAPESLWSLLVMARQLIDQGKPSLALQAVMTAMRSVGGENAMLQTLERARELYRNKLQANAAADELASLFAECAIAEAQPLNYDRSQPPPPQQQPAVWIDTAADVSILGRSGRKQVMLDAFADGSSFICLECGALVSKLRKDEHLAYWCSNDL